MNLMILFVYLSALIITVAIGWWAYQITLVAWGSDKASEKYKIIQNHPWFVLFHPLFKWGGPVIVIQQIIILVMAIYNGALIINGSAI